MKSKPLNILLADDDTDDRIFFTEALTELMLNINLNSVNDGEQLMNKITNEVTILPDIIFIDLNMPRKNGFECLTEIRLRPNLKAIPIVIFSTSYEQDVVDSLYDNGAHYFVRKPVEFAQFKKIINKTFLKLLGPNSDSKPSRENFVLTLQNSTII